MEDKVKRYQASEGRAKQRAFDAIYNDMAGLVHTLAKRPGNKRDDLAQEGFIALAAAADSFDPSLGVPFYNFARQRVRWAISNAERINIRNHTREVYSPLEAPAKTVPNQLDALELDATLDRFTGRDRQVVEMLAAGFSGVEVAARFGISEQRASQIIARIRKGL